jgi:signal transduction histidine kinase
MISLYVAKRLSAPLVEMKNAAEQITRGKLTVRTSIRGNDELADLGKALNHLAEQLQKQEKLRVTMTQDIAHELRTPLATLKSHMQAMLDQIWDPTPARLRACYEETERLIALVADLEQLTVMDSPHFRLQRKPEDLSTLIQQSLGIVAAAFMEKGVRLDVMPHLSVRLHVDRDRFIQVLVNVLTNALKFTPEKGQVKIQVQDENDTVLIAIQDTGTGIAPNDLPYVFERFYRVDKSRNRKMGGAGIGLTIVKKLVEAHGGTVWIESDKGTTVYLRFPK